MESFSGDRSRFREPRGYVLVVVLVVLVIAAAALAGVCRMSLRQALHARRAQEDLQRRWGVTTCRAVLLPKVESMLNQADPPTGEVRRDVHLGGQTITLVFGDEQSKANVNALYRAGGLTAAERALRQFAGASDRLLVELRPLPQRRAKEDETEPPVFEGFGQLFAAGVPGGLIETPAGGTLVASVFTCWGDGALNFRRASDDAVREICRPHAPAAQITRLLQLRAKSPGTQVADLLDQLQLSDKARETLDEILVDESTCHSLWIITRGGERSWYDLAVADDASQSSGQALLFSW